MEAKQSVPSVLARLMGLDELQPQQPVKKKPRVLSENYLQRVASIGIRSKSVEHHPFRLNIEEKNGYEDIFQVSETLKRGRHFGESADKGESHSSSSEVKLTFKGRDVNHVILDKKLRSSKKHYGVSEINDTETDSFVKYPHTQDLLATKNLNLPEQSQSGQKTFSKSLYGSGYRDTGEHRKSGTGVIEQGHFNLLGKHENGTGLYSFAKTSLSSRSKSLGRELQLYNGIGLLTPGIVVLKRKLEKPENAARFFHSSTGSHLVFRSGMGRHGNIRPTLGKSLNVDMKGRKKSINSVELGSTESNVSREIAKKQGNGINTLSAEAPKSRDRPGMFDGSNEVSPNCGTRDLHTPVCDSDRKDRHVRHRMRSRSLLPELNAAGSPNSGARHHSLQNCNQDSVKKDVSAGRNSVLLGQDSKDVSACRNSVLIDQDSDKKDVSACRNSVLIGNMSPSFSNAQSEKNHSKEATYVIQNNQNGKHEEGENSCHQSLGVFLRGQSKPHSQDSCVTKEAHKREGSDGNLSDQKLLVCIPSRTDDPSICVGADMVAAAETDNVCRSPVLHKVQQLEAKEATLSIEDEDCSSDVLDPWLQQDMSSGISEGEVSSSCSGTDHLSSEEAYLSPDSVLQRLYGKDIFPLTDCSGGVCIPGLSMHLQLLKSETLETYSEGSSMTVPGDEDDGEGSRVDSEESEDRRSSFRIEDNRNFSYLADVLKEAGFHSGNGNLHMSSDVWHSQECLMSTTIFEKLEKKYGEDISWERSDRRLLFDRINSGLLEILQPSIGLPMWRKPVAKRLHFKLSQDLIEEELWMLLATQEKEVSKDSEKVLGKDDGWFSLRDDIQIIGREIENSLVDELVEEVVSMDTF